MPTTGADLIAKNITKFGNQFTNSVNKTMVEVHDRLDAIVTASMSLDDHTLAEIRAAGSPYSVRKWGVGGKADFHDPMWLVHTHSGLLLSSKSGGIVPAEIEGGVLKATAYVMLDPAVAAYATSVVYGTSKMIPRPFLEMSKQQVQPELYDFIKTRLKNITLS